MEFDKSAIVVAHPDDEILWMPSLVNRVARIIMCYSDDPAVKSRGDKRRAAVARYPTGNVSLLDLPEPRTKPGGGVPGASLAGLFARNDPEAPHRTALVEALRPQLAGFNAVITHNPWGEYGHKDHVRVNSVVQELAGAMNIKVYVSCYAGVRALGRCAAEMQKGIAVLDSAPIDHEFVEGVVALYKRSDCWTWVKDWRWPDQDHFFVLGSREVTKTIFPIRVFDMGR